MAELWQAVQDHRASIEKSGQLERRRAARTRRELRQIVVNRLEVRARELCGGATYDELEPACSTATSIRGRRPTSCSGRSMRRPLAVAA